MDFSGLLEKYSAKGRTAYNPIMMYAVMLYANMRGFRAIDSMVELCRRDIGFITLTQGKRPKRDAFYAFFNDRLTSDILENLHYQFIHILEKKGFVTLKELYIDGTKIEANANRYTLVLCQDLVQVKMRFFPILTSYLQFTLLYSTIQFFIIIR